MVGVAVGVPMSLVIFILAVILVVVLVRRFSGAESSEQKLESNVTGKFTKSTSSKNVQEMFSFSVSPRRKPPNSPEKLNTKYEDMDIGPRFSSRYRSASDESLQTADIVQQPEAAPHYEPVELRLESLMKTEEVERVSAERVHGEDPPARSNDYETIIEGLEEEQETTRGCYENAMVIN